MIYKLVAKGDWSLRKNYVSGDTNTVMVVCAESDYHARIFAAANHGMEGSLAWMDLSTTVTEIDTNEAQFLACMS